MRTRSAPTPPYAPAVGPTAKRIVWFGPQGCPRRQAAGGRARSDGAELDLKSVAVPDRRCWGHRAPTFFRSSLLFLDVPSATILRARRRATDCFRTIQELLPRRGDEPGRPSALRRPLIDLGFQYSLYEQAPFLSQGIAAVTLTTAGDRQHSSVSDTKDRLSGAKLQQIGGAARERRWGTSTRVSSSLRARRPTCT